MADISIAASDVRDWLTEAGGTVTGDAPQLTRATTAAMEFVNRNNYGITTDSERELAAIMLAARLFERRNSSTGLQLFTAMDGAMYVSRYDADINRLLGADVPQVG